MKRIENTVRADNWTEDFFLSFLAMRSMNVEEMNWKLFYFWLFYLIQVQYKKK